MKRFLITLIITASTLSLSLSLSHSPAYAVDCGTMDGDPAACGYTPGCNYSGGKCNSVGPFSGYVDAYNNLIGLNSDLTTIGGVVSALLPWLIILGGIILLFMLIWGGFQMLTAAGNPDKAALGQKIITSAVAGFFILFVGYWIGQILEIVFGISFL